MMMMMMELIMKVMTMFIMVHHCTSFPLHQGFPLIYLSIHHMYQSVYVSIRSPRSIPSVRVVMRISLEMVSDDDDYTDE